MQINTVKNEKREYKKPELKTLGSFTQLTTVGNSTPAIDPNDAKMGSNPNPNAG